MRSEQREERRNWIVRAALFAPLVLLLVVAAMTWRAERRIETMTSHVVHDYAAIAAWQYARRATNALHHEAMQAFRGIAQGHQRSDARELLHPAARILDARTDHGPLLLRHARFVFTYETRTGRFEFAGGAVDDATR